MEIQNSELTNNPQLSQISQIQKLDLRHLPTQVPLLSNFPKTWLDPVSAGV
jgi:hypothetical protein